MACYIRLCRIISLYLVWNLNQIHLTRRFFSFICFIIKGSGILVVDIMLYEWTERSTIRVISYINFLLEGVVNLLWQSLIMVKGYHHPCLFLRIKSKFYPSKLSLWSIEVNRYEWIKHMVVKYFAWEIYIKLEVVCCVLHKHQTRISSF